MCRFLHPCIVITNKNETLCMYCVAGCNRVTVLSNDARGSSDQLKCLNEWGVTNPTIRFTNSAIQVNSKICTVLFFFFLIFFLYKMSPVLLATHLLVTDCINEICHSSFSWVLKFRDFLHVQHHCYHCSYPHCRGTNRPHCHLSCQEEGQAKVRHFGIWAFLFPT